MLISFVFANPKKWYKKIGSKVICEIDDSIASHFAIILRSYSGDWVYESVWPRARKLRLEEWNKEYEIVKDYHFKPPKELAYDILVSLDRFINTPYATSQIFAIWISSISKYLEVSMKMMILNHEKGLICTEIGSRFIQRFMRVHIFESHDMIGVSDLQEIIEEAMMTEGVWKVA